VVVVGQPPLFLSEVCNAVKTGLRVNKDEKPKRTRALCWYKIFEDWNEL